jgi:hypothetical protein
MELDINVEEIEIAGEEQRLQESKTIARELATQEPIIFEEESLTLHHATFNKNSRKLVIEKVNSKNKKIQEKWNSKFDFQGVPPSKVMEFHEATGEALKFSIGDIENENAILKDRVRELENALMPPPLFSSPITTIQPLKTLEGRPESSSRLKGTSSLLAAIRRYVGDNIQKRMSLILETWELATNFVSLGSRMTHFRQYLQADLENDEEFYKGVISTFSARVSSLSEFRKKEEDFPSTIHLKQLKACWLKRIKSLKEMLVECDVISVKRGELYLKLIELELVGSTEDVEDPHLIMNSILLSKEQMEEKLDSLKIASTKKFNNLTEYSETEVESWLVHYVNKNDDIEDTLHQLSMDFKDLENSLFDIKVRQEIMVAPMREYIENWLKNALIKITESDQEKTITTGQVVPAKESIKDIPTRQMKERESITVSQVVIFHNFPSSILLI